MSATTTKNFFSLSDKERLKFYKTKYIKERLSWQQIAELVGTYKSKVMRDAKKLGVESRSYSEAQKQALVSGRSPHPTKGKQLSEETKNKISAGVGKYWDELDDEAKEKHIQRCRELWYQKSPEERKEFIAKSLKAVHDAARDGSKMERHLYDVLTQAGYRVDRHKKHILLDREFHVDLLVRDCRTIIELDGPSHYAPIFGEEELQRTQKTDSEKTGIALSAGFVVMRIRITNRTSKRYLKAVADVVLEHLSKIKKSFPPKGERYIEVWMTE